MDTESLKRIISEGESTEIELKQSFHSVQDIAKTISAFANTQGGILAIGVKDDGSIEGVSEDTDLLQQKIAQSNSIVHPAPILNIDIHTIEKKKVIAAIVHKADASVFHSVEGVIYIRLGSTIQKLEGQSIVEFLRNRQILLFEEAIEPSARQEDLDAGKIRAYLELRKQPDYLKSHSIEEFLISKKLASFQPGLKIKNLALLFFAKDPQEHFFYNKIKLVRFDGKEPVKVLAYEEAKGSLPQMIEQAMNFVGRFTAREFVIEGARRKEIPQLPEEAVREAITNAVAHRDYFNKNETQLSIFDDRLEVTNPGGLPEGMSRELLGALSVQRNPRIYQYLKDYGYMEGIGSGISRIYRIMRESGLEDPEFVTPKGIFRIILRMKKEHAAEALSERQARALEALSGAGKIKSKEYAQINKVSTPTAVKDLAEMEKIGLVKKIGTYRGAYYQINEKKAGYYKRKKRGAGNRS